MITQKEIFDIVKDFSSKAKSQYITPENFTYNENRWGLETTEIDFCAKNGSNNNFFKYYSINNPLDPNRFLPYQENRIVHDFNYFSIFRKIDVLERLNLNEAKIFVEDISEIFTLIRKKMLLNKKDLENTLLDYENNLIKIDIEIKSSKEKINTISKELINKIVSLVGYENSKMEKLNLLTEEMEKDLYKINQTKERLLNIIKDTESVINTNNFRSFLSLKDFKEIYSVENISSELRNNDENIDISNYFNKSSIIKKNHIIVNDKKKYIEDNIAMLFLKKHENSSQMEMVKDLNSFYSQCFAREKMIFIPNMGMNDKIVKKIEIETKFSPFVFISENGEDFLVQNPLFISQTNDFFKRAISNLVLYVLEKNMKVKKKQNHVDFEFVEESKHFIHNVSENFINLNQKTKLNGSLTYGDVFYIKKELKENEKKALLDLAKGTLEICNVLLYGKVLDTRDENEINLIRDDFLNLFDRMVRERNLKEKLNKEDEKEGDIKVKRKI